MGAGPGSETHLERLVYWLRAIHTEAPEAPVLLVGTHQCAPGAEGVLGELRRALAREPFYGQIKAIVGVENNPHVAEASGRGSMATPVAELRRLIDATAGAMPHMQEVMPLRWLRMLRRRAELLQDGTRYFVDFTEFAKEAMQCGAAATDAEAEELALFLHDTGEIVRCDLASATSIVVLDPQWLLDAMLEVLTDREALSEDEQFKLDQSAQRLAWGKLLHDRLARGIEEAWSVPSGGAEIVKVVGQDWLSGHDRTWYNKAPEATLQQGGFGDMWARLHRTGPSMLSPLSRLFLAFLRHARPCLGWLRQCPKVLPA